MSDQADARGGGGIDQTDARGNSGNSNPYSYAQKAPAARLTTEEFDSDFYKMNHSHRGHAVVINNWKFDDPKNPHNELTKSKEDGKKMKELLSSMGFTVQVHNNCSVKAMENVMREVSDMNHQNSDCFVCVVLSYGEEGFFHGTDGSIQMDNFIEPIKGGNCPSLAFKPKIFLIQACEEVVEGLECEEISDGAEADEYQVVTRRIPAEADIIMMYSVLPIIKDVSFMQSVYTEFTKTKGGQPAWKTLDLLSLMTRVNKSVSLHLDQEASLAHYKERLPCITSMLTKELVFC